jgi:carboxyl-terminal processing protease
VLLGPQTGSAGERVALAFRQRPRTRSFGRPTAGVATTRGWTLLPDGAVLAITTSTMDTTRTRENLRPTTPDVLVTDLASQDDRVLSAAAEWVAATGCSATSER